MENLIAFIEAYGYIAVFFGSIFEGESVLLLGGLAAHNGYLAFSLVVVCAFFGALAGDWGFFLLGRYKKDALFRRFPKLTQLTATPRSMIERRPAFISFGMRFMYGFRHIVPMSIGISNVPIGTFLLWNSIGAFSWSVLMVSLGYLAGDFLASIFGGIRGHEFRIIVIVVVAVVLFNYALRLIRSILRSRSGG